jgi:hypothetical protein
VLTLATHELIRRFLMSGVATSTPSGPADEPNQPQTSCVAVKAASTKPEQPKAPEHPCPCCGSHMRIVGPLAAAGGETLLTAGVSGLMCTTPDPCGVPYRGR